MAIMKEKRLCPNFFSYRFLPNFKKLCDIINHESLFQRKDFPQLHRF